MARSPLFLGIVALAAIEAALVVLMWSLGVPRNVVWVCAGLMGAGLPLAVGEAWLGRRLHDRPDLLASMRRPRAALLLNVGVAVAVWFATAAIMLATGGSYLAKLIGTTQHMAFFLGLALVGFGCRREGDQKLCRKCEYEMSPRIEAEPGMDRCPECGSHWRGVMGTVRGRRRARWRWIVAGVCLAALLMVWPWVSMRNPGLRRAPLYALPKGSLMAEATASSFNNSEDAVKVLQARGMTPAQEERLARMLLDRQKTKGYIAQGPRDWLTAKQASGTLSPELSNRFVEEHPYPALIVPDRLRLGLPAAPAVAGP